MVHAGLYFFAFLILLAGGLIASQRNLFGYVLGTGPVTDGRGGLAGSLHEFGWTAILGLLILHVGAAVYHQFIIRDNLFRRMWFAK